MSKKIKIKVIIGANYGDEGKGLATHYFADELKQADPECRIVNVLYNGGSQRGHTVDIAEGESYVMHHLGSAFYDGAYTYFDQDFMINPAVYVDEIIKYELFDWVQHYNYIHPDCRVVTPYDIFLNQIVEDSRGDNRHGSCGCGIWETKVRYKCSEYNKNFEQMENMKDNELRQYLHQIATVYLPQRLKEYGIEKYAPVYTNLILSEMLREHYISDLRYMSKHCCGSMYAGNITSDAIIYEGSQGLALDCDNLRMYPNVTASKTTSETPIKRIKELIKYSPADVEICYVTRSYFTRHGAGYFPSECDKSKINKDIEDSTNVHNKYQGEIRYGQFEAHEFKQRVKRDIEFVRDNLPEATISLMVTHTNYTQKALSKDFFKTICASLGIQKLYWSETKFAEDIQII